MGSAEDDFDWTRLLKAIRERDCTPFLGAGASVTGLATTSDAARQWAGRFDYPLSQQEDLSSVAQFLAIKVNAIEPKDTFARLCRDAAGEPNPVLRVLAGMPFRIYITTNFDDFLFKAVSTARDVKSRRKRPRWGLSGWKRAIELEAGPTLIDPSGYVPSVSEPYVYYLHGHHQFPQSLVLTEDDHVSFLLWLTRLANGPPPSIRGAFTRKSLLFIGYNHRDWTFRALLRGLLECRTAWAQRVDVWMQLARDAHWAGRGEVAEYLQRYYAEQIGVRFGVYWGEVEAFGSDLRARWERVQPLNRVGKRGIIPDRL